MNGEDQDIQKINEYEIAKKDYENSNVIKKLVMKIKGQAPSKKKPLRFAIKYKYFRYPFYSVEEHESYNRYLDEYHYHNHYDSDPIPVEGDKNIDELWTMVEYIGDGIFIDLITGKKIQLAKPVGYFESKAHNCSTQSEYEETIKSFEEMKEIPLGITNVGLRFLGDKAEDVDIKESILNDTLPAREEITEMLNKKEDISRKRIVSEFESASLEEHYKENEQKRLAKEKEEQEEKRQLEEQRRQVELKKMEEERIKEQKRIAEQERIDTINNSFEKTFPKH